MVMHIYQPMLYVGIGGTGCKIGEQLEKQLRDELCGPDGRALLPHPAFRNSNMKPFQLPPFLQFVYIDLEQSQVRETLSKAPKDVADRNAVGVSGILTAHDGYPDCAKSLRLAKPTPTWLPPPAGEPKIAPLDEGAGQFPTVARATLHESFRSYRSHSPITEPLETAVDRLSDTGSIQALTNRPPRRAIDVFVGFSVAGGTGCGLFLDVLYLVAETVKEKLRGFTPHLYPLVMMPSAFPFDDTKARAAELNGAKATVDLSRLLDRQNSNQQVSISTPAGRLEMPGASPRTGFLFSRPTGVQYEDMLRSVASFVMSLVGSFLQDSREGTASQDQQMTFAANFVNELGTASELSSVGIGRRGLTTALVASMQIPLDRIAGILADRLVARGITDLSEVPLHENNTAFVEEMINTTGLAGLRDRPYNPVGEIDPELEGAGDINEELRRRETRILEQINRLHRRLHDQDLPKMAALSPSPAFTSLLSELDLFRARRVALGVPQSDDPKTRVGFRGFVRLSARSPKAEPGFRLEAPPDPPAIVDRFLRKAKASSETVRDYCNTQNAWLRWRAHHEWQTGWAGYTKEWSRGLLEFETTLNNLTSEFDTFARDESSRFTRGCADLFASKKSVVLFVPPGGVNNDLSPFYRRVIPVMRNRLGLDDDAGEAAILQAIVGRDNGWATIWKRFTGEGISAADAVRYVRGLVKKEVLATVSAPPESNQEVLLPRMAELLRSAAVGNSEDEIIQSFRVALNGLIPAGFRPAGVESAPMKVLVTYPAGANDVQIEDYLSKQLGGLSDLNPEFEPSDADAIVVSMLRSTLSLHQVPEVMDGMRLWLSAMSPKGGQANDKLPWRQRLSYTDPWLLGEENDLVVVLQHMLSAIYEGSVQIEGSEDSPGRVSFIVVPDNPHATRVTLPLRPLGRSSSWGSLLEAYERHVVTAEQNELEACEVLMRAEPQGTDGSGRAQPSRLFLDLVGRRETEIKVLEENLAAAEDGGTPQLRMEGRLRFWRDLLPAAMRHPFNSGEYYENLQQMLAASVGEGGQP